MNETIAQFNDQEKTGHYNEISMINEPAYAGHPTGGK